MAPASCLRMGICPQVSLSQPCHWGSTEPVGHQQTLKVFGPSQSCLHTKLSKGDGAMATENHTSMLEMEVAQCRKHHSTWHCSVSDVLSSLFPPNCHPTGKFLLPHLPLLSSFSVSLPTCWEGQLPEQDCTDIACLPADD